MDGAVPRLMLVGALGLGLTALTSSGPSGARTMQEISMQVHEALGSSACKRSPRRPPPPHSTSCLTCSPKGG
jgi:hypothetical protein